MKNNDRDYRRIQFLSPSLVRTVEGRVCEKCGFNGPCHTFSTGVAGSREMIRCMKCSFFTVDGIFTRTTPMCVFIGGGRVPEQRCFCCLRNTLRRNSGRRRIKNPLLLGTRRYSKSDDGYLNATPGSESEDDETRLEILLDRLGITEINPVSCECVIGSRYRRSESVFFDQTTEMLLCHSCFVRQRVKLHQFLFHLFMTVEPRHAVGSGRAVQIMGKIGDFEVRRKILMMTFPCCNRVKKKGIDMIKEVLG